MAFSLSSIPLIITRQKEKYMTKFDNTFSFILQKIQNSAKTENKNIAILPFAPENIV